jgi:hypothetical protein
MRSEWSFGQFWVGTTRSGHFIAGHAVDPVVAEHEQRQLHLGDRAVSADPAFEDPPYPATKWPGMLSNGEFRRSL